jgi:Fic family protein
MNLVKQQLLKEFFERYLNKKEIMYRLPAPFSIEEFWPEVLKHRKNIGKKLTLPDQNNNNFWFGINEKLTKNIDYINKFASVDLFNSLPDEMSENIINEVLIDEAFNSSVIEGAFSTRKRSQEIIKKNNPVNKDEQMIYNNYKALEYVLQNLHRHMDEDMILDIYRLVTHNTLDKDDIVEKYRNDKVYVWNDGKQEVVYEAPKHDKVQEFMDKLIEFINSEDDGIHPVVKASIIHFYFVYIHPFFDGNGRTARTLSFMYLLKNGYSYFKFFSISGVLKEERSKYYKALKDVEDFDSDMTYFINYMSEMIVKAIEITLILFKKEFAYMIIKHKLVLKKTFITGRIDKALKQYLKKNIAYITIEEHQKKYKSSYETARTDLNALVSLGIFEKSKEGKKFVYRANDIDVILRKLENSKG